jgi:hypothetical protein
MFNRSFKVLFFKIKQSEKVINEVLEGIAEKRTILDITLHKKVNLVGHILRVHCLHLCDASKGEIA